MRGPPWSGATPISIASFEACLQAIGPVLAPGGWLALTEVDDLFGHAPLAARWRDLVERYYAASLAEGVYRFRSHDHVTEVLGDRGWHVEIDRNLDDDEFCFARAPVARPRVVHPRAVAQDATVRQLTGDPLAVPPRV